MSFHCLRASIVFVCVLGDRYQSYILFKVICHFSLATPKLFSLFSAMTHFSMSCSFLEAPVSAEIFLSFRKFLAITSLDVASAHVLYSFSMTPT